MYTYKHPHFAICTDILLFSTIDNEKAILLIQRKHDPFKDYWAFPGGFAEIDEQIIDAAYRELEEETGITNVQLTFFNYFDAVNRDPRERSISFVYHTTIPSPSDVQPIAQDDAKEVRWFKLTALPPLAFDHHQILASFIQ